MSEDIRTWHISDSWRKQTFERCIAATAAHYNATEFFEQETLWQPLAQWILAIQLDFLFSNSFS